MELKKKIREMAVRQEYLRVTFYFLGLRFTWICRNSSQKFSDDLLEIPVALPRPSAANLDSGGCFGTGAGNIGGNHSIFKIDSSYMTENSSYFITVVVEKHPRRAYFTQEVIISPGDPPVVEIRYGHRIHKNRSNR